MWLNDSWLRNTGHEIKCIRLQPHRYGEEILIESSVVIPLPEASDYQTQLGQREQETRLESSGKVQNVLGADAFKESIGYAPEKCQTGLQRLYDAAMEMEEAKIVDLEMRINGKRDHYQINLLVPGKSQSLVSFANLLRKGRGGEISVWPTVGAFAPSAGVKIDELIDVPKSKSGVRYRRLSIIKESDLDAILVAIRAAYQEAGGPPIE